MRPNLKFETFDVISDRGPFRQLAVFCQLVPHLYEDSLEIILVQKHMKTLFFKLVKKFEPTPNYGHAFEVVNTAKNDGRPSGGSYYNINSVSIGDLTFLVRAECDGVAEKKEILAGKLSMKSKVLDTCDFYEIKATTGENGFKKWDDLIFQNLFGNVKLVRIGAIDDNSGLIRMSVDERQDSLERKYILDDETKRKTYLGNLGKLAALVKKINNCLLMENAGPNDVFILELMLKRSGNHELALKTKANSSSASSLPVNSMLTEQVLRFFNIN